MVGGLAAENGRACLKMLHKETTPHALAPSDSQCYTNDCPTHSAMHRPRALGACAASLLVFSALLGLSVIPSVARARDNRALIIDTDAGSDDLMAIAFLLSRDDIRVEAITVANGLAHVRAGAANLLRLLELSGKKNIPVYVGCEQPLRGSAAFPEEWRNISDMLPGVELPAASQAPEPQSAAEYLATRLRGPGAQVQILALGPLTNLAQALQRAPSSVRTIEEIVMMGGAVRVPGNLGDGGYFRTDNKTAEWNMFVDPLAAKIVFNSGANIRLIPLDATNRVPIDASFLREFESRARTPLGRFVAQILEGDRKFIEQGIYSAWDPLAAVALVHPAVVRTRPLAIEIRQQSPEEGRTREITAGRPNAKVALDANAALFKEIFFRAFLD